MGRPGAFTEYPVPVANGTACRLGTVNQGVAVGPVNDGDGCQPSNHRLIAETWMSTSTMAPSLMATQRACGPPPGPPFGFGRLRPYRDTIPAIRIAARARQSIKITSNGHSCRQSLCPWQGDLFIVPPISHPAQQPIWLRINKPT